MPDIPISLRELARSLGLSHTTVSEALRGSPKVKPETSRIILKAARKAGYRHNPLAGALMSEIRRSRTQTFRGVLAIFDFDGPEGRPAFAARFHQALARGASERASELGFRTETLSLERGNISLKRFETILQARGIRGIFLLPVRENPDLTQLDWKHFAGIYADYVIDRPALHTICSAHYRSMLTVLDRLRDMGYQRPGLVMNRPLDSRLLYRWESAYHAYQTHHDGMTRLPPLISDNITEAEFALWFKSVQPDVVLCHNPALIGWMENAGARVPRTHGFCCLNVANAEAPCAGLDLQPRVLGARGIELLIGQLLRNEYGIPEIPSNTTVPARWVDGPTVRKRRQQGFRKTSGIPHDA